MGSRWFAEAEQFPGIPVDAQELTPDEALRWILEAGQPIPDGLKELAEQTRVR
ncbi:hypothetical protein SH661x_000660 [Planctomicrobium sp. SH661]|uniref:hypothetical protein n=1 Tax=Planctomicrobium sp. SH661 TaxID=3448124 RepID=UPI003F5C0128